MDREEIKELGALEAAGALGPAERREIERLWREGGPEERQELRELLEAAALLPLALPRTEVSSDLKSQLMSRLMAERREGEPIDGRVIPFAPPARAERGAVFWLPLAASLLFASLSLWLYLQNARLNREVASLSAQATRTAEQLASARSELNEVVSRTTRLVALSGVDASPQANAKVFWDTDAQEWVIYIFNLPLPPSDKDYQLWYITHDQRKIGASVFRPEPDGQVALRFKIPRDLAPRLAATAVTLEPKGGSPQPTGQFYLKGAI
jgi:anti-sigma-K factor RskA